MSQTNIQLQRIDADKGMYRFYELSLQPDLFGGCQVVRHWGRIGAHGGQQRHELFANERGAQERLDALCAAKSRKGYRSGAAR